MKNHEKRSRASSHSLLSGVVLIDDITPIVAACYIVGFQCVNARLTVCPTETGQFLLLKIESNLGKILRRCEEIIWPK